jgi:predicted alpha-1,2-mannosidase
MMQQCSAKAPLVTVSVLYLWLCFLLVATPGHAYAQAVKEPVDYVNPNIGTIAHLLRSIEPIVQLPHGVVRLGPVTTPGIKDEYLADKIYGFPVAYIKNHMVAGPMLMATTGPTETDPGKYASLFDHDLETVSPYHYAVTLETYDILAEYTVTPRAAYYRFTFPADDTSHVLISMRDSAAFEVLSPTVVAGYEESSGARYYFHAEWSKPFPSYCTWRGNVVRREASKQAGASIGVITDFKTLDRERVDVRIGVSFISTDQARRNLMREIPEWDFEHTKTQARRVWNHALSRIAVNGGTEEQRIIFYTALYRSLKRLINITEDGEYYSGYDKHVHSAEGHDFYVEDNAWDTHRTVHPLQLLLEPEVQVDMVRSYLRMYDQTGWLPSAVFVGGERATMIGHHVAAFIVDTYMKGYRDFDVGKAYVAMRKNAMEATMLPRRSGPLSSLDRMFLDKGFFPALGKGEVESVKEVDPLERRQAVSVTLAHAYLDWCLAQMAKALGKEDDYAYFMRRARNYESVFDTRIGFMAPRTADGKFIEGFDPKWSGGQGGRDYFSEMNGWTFTFHVEHDVAGLINLMGGRDRFVEKLDSLFTEQYGGNKFVFLNQFPDMTGLIGQFAIGNEPSNHIPYLYNYAGAPWKTQRMVREIMNVWFNAGPLGLPGAEDGGSLSSWYVLSAMGFYPVCPGRAVYDIGSPIFDEVKIMLGNGKVFTIEAKGVSAKNKYIQSAELNGKPLNKPWFAHGDIAEGGRLVLRMGPRPNKTWGSSPDAAPPSMSQEGL